MNRQPLILSQQGSHHYWDEDLDQREVLPNGVIVAFTIRKSTKKPKGPASFTPSFLAPDQSWWIGHITNRHGFNINIWRLCGNRSKSMEIRGLETRDEAIDLAKRLIQDLYS